MAKRSKTTSRSAKRGGRKKAVAKARPGAARVKKAATRTKVAKKKVASKSRAATPKKKSARRPAKKSKAVARAGRKKKVAKKRVAKKKSPRRGSKKTTKRSVVKSASVRGGRKIVKRTAAKEAPKKVARKASKRTVARRAVAAPRQRALDGANTAAPSATSQDPIQFPEEALTTPKTYLTAAQLAQFRDLLLLKRRELSGDVQDLTRDAFQKDSGNGERTMMPIHMADLGSDNWEHEFTLGLIENEQGRIRQIDEALARIAKKTYGICVATHRRINVARLRAKPWAKYCIDHARAREEGRIR